LIEATICREVLRKEQVRGGIDKIAARQMRLNARAWLVHSRLARRGQMSLSV
jgi:hypothetical protein